MKETVMQFGEGGFLRGFVDYFFKKLNDAGVYEGKVVVKNQENSYRLSQGELFIHEPNSLHSLQLLTDCQPNIFIASFYF